MRSKVILEQNGKWSVVNCKLNGPMIETGIQTFKFNSEDEATKSISDEYMEIKHELMPIIFGDSYRRIFVHVEDFNK